MKEVINLLQIMGVKTLACCCGHSKYERTVIIEKNGKAFEYYSDVLISRKKRFYKRDKQGVFFIPELAIVGNKVMEDKKP